MNRSKLSLAVALALVLILGLAASSWARGPGGGAGGMNLTPEQAGKMFDLRQKFMNDTAAARKQMFVKRAEMKDLWRAEKPDEKAIQAKLKEVNALREQVMEKGVALRLEAQKIAPNAGFGHGWGCGMGHGGMGMGMGHGGGMGPGCGMGPGGMGMGPGPDPGPGGGKAPAKGM